jgi:hypothetical protein
VSRARDPVLVVGMSRSGTTLAQRMLALLPGVHVETEPHMLWKSGSFSHLVDDRYELDPDAIGWIRRKLLSAADGRVLVDKSPANCLRPGLVHAVFPEARVVYLQRDPVRCVYSNYQKSLGRQSLHPRIVVGKYLLGTGPGRDEPNAGDLGDSVDATGGRKLYSQIRPSELPAFVRYAARLFWLRNVRKTLPFGPKITDFWSIVADEGLLAYHARAVVAAEGFRSEFEARYGPRFSLFRLERLQDEVSEVERLFEACGFSPPNGTVERIAASLNPSLISRSRAPSDVDDDIRALLHAAGRQA